MTAIYEAKVKHTREMLDHFVRLTFEVKNSTMNIKLTVFSIGWWVLAYLARTETVMSIVLCILGAVCTLFTCFRKYIGISSLAKHDEIYKNDGEIQLYFGHKGFSVTDTLSEDVKQITYQEVTALYKDKKFYFLAINNEEMQIMNHRELNGAPEAFEQFIEEKVGKEFYEVNLPIGKACKRWFKNAKTKYTITKMEIQTMQKGKEERIQEERKNKKKNK